MGIVYNVEKSRDFKTRMLEAEQKLVVAYFYTERSGACKKITPVVDRIVEDRDLILIKVDVDKALVLSESQDVNGVPTIKIYKDEKLLSHFSKDRVCEESLFLEINRWI